MNTPEQPARDWKEGRPSRRALLGNVGVVAIVLVAIALLIFGGDGEGTDNTAATGTAPREPEESRLVANAEPRQPTWTRRRGAVPILSYHDIGNPVGDEDYPDLFVSPREFRSQIEFLARRGWEAVTLDRVQKAWFEEGTLPSKPIVISFDDGYIGQYEYAFPLLKKHGWPGVLNLRVEDSGLYSEQVRPMLRAGWELASHGNRNVDLTTLDSETLLDEVVGSRTKLQEKYDVVVNAFVYPGGDYDENVLATVEAAGYRGAMGTDFGFASSDEPFTLERIIIRRGHGIKKLRAALRAAGGS